jgi:hypothetical protein
MAEQLLVTNTDQANLYRDADSQVYSLQVHVTRGGAAGGTSAPAGTKVLLVQFVADTTPNQKLGIIDVSSPTPRPIQLVDEHGNTIEQEVSYEKEAGGGQGKTPGAVVTTGSDGMATVYYRCLGPGFPAIQFLAYQGDAMPVPSASFSYGTAGFTQFRIYPDDSPLKQQFIALWNSSLEADQATRRQAAWTFVYNNILYLYDALYPVMLRYVNLGNLEVIEGAKDRLARVLSDEWQEEGSMFMPITRDLSGGKKWILQEWVALMRGDYPAEPIPRPRRSA